MKKPKLVLTILTFSIILVISAQNGLSADNTLDMELSKSVSTVNSLLEFNDKLYAGTHGYLYPECGEIYVYDDETGWKLDLFVPNAIQVYSLCEYENKLYAGTGNPDAKIYVYDPVTDSWDVSFDPPDSMIRGLCVYNGKLYASGGNMGYIYAYDGIDWELVDQIRPYHWLGAFVEYDGKLFLGVGSNWAHGAIYVYDGYTWELIWSSTSIWEITSLIVYDGKIYAAGWGFDAISNTRKGTILVYDGSWNSIFESDQDFYSLQVYGNKLYTGGGDRVTSNAAKIYSFDGYSWEIAYEFTSYYERIFWSMGSYRNRLYVGATSAIYVSQEHVDELPPPIKEEPLDGEILNTRTIDFKWEKVEQAAGYLIVIDDDPLFGSYDYYYIPGGNTVSWSYTFLQDDTYYWSMSTVNSEGVWGDWSTPWSFTINTILPPPIKEEPLDGEILNTRTIDFKWEKVEQAAGYLIVIDDDPLFGSYDYYYIPGGNTVSWSYTFLQDDTYYWSMSTVNSEGVWGDWSTPWSFIIDTSN